MRQEILVGPERRRRWSDIEKMAIVLEAAEADVTVTDVARRHDITRQQIYQWRSAMRRGQLADENGGPFLSVEFVDATDIGVDAGAPAHDAGCGAQIEISLRKGRILRTPTSIAPGVLTCLIRATEAA